MDSKIGDEANSEKHEEEIMGARSSVGMQIIRGLNKGIPPARIAEEYLPELVTRVLEAWKSLKEDEYWSCHKLLNDEEHTPMGSDRPFIVSGHLGLMRAVRQQEERYGNIIVQRNVVIGVLNGARYREHSRQVKFYELRK